MQKKKRNAEQTEKNLLSAAENLIAQNGYAATSMRDIAAAAKIRAATAYYYFPSKKDLVKTLFKGYYQELSLLYEKLDETLPKKIPLRSALIRFLEAHYFFLKRNLNFAFLFFQETLRPGSPLQNEIKAFSNKSTSVLKNMVTRWPGLSSKKALSLFLAVVSVNTFFLVAKGYLKSVLGAALTEAEYLSVIKALFSAEVHLENIEHLALDLKLQNGIGKKINS